MGEKKQTSQTTSRTTIDPRSQQESQLIRLFQGLANQAGSQLGEFDLSSLLSGDSLVPTDSDFNLANQAIEATGSTARRQLQDFVREGNLGLDETLSARGVQGSSIEAVNRGLVTRDANRQLANILDSERGQQANLLTQLPFQRANVQLGANQQLLQQLGLGQFASNFGLQERLAQGTTRGSGTQRQSGFSTGDLLETGAAIFGG